MSKQATNPKDLSQKRAAQAWAYVKAGKAKAGEDYGSLTQRLTQMVQINGLAATAAFLKSKEKREHFKLLYDQLSEWVGGQVYDARPQELMKEIIEGSSDDLRRATAEAIAFSIWMRRFSEAEFGDVRSADKE